MKLFMKLVDKCLHHGAGVCVRATVRCQHATYHWLRVMQGDRSYPLV
jgi:hypothetical protein